jgi:hypothetical protein
MTRLLAILAYPIAYVLVFGIFYAQAPGKPLVNWWRSRRG